MKTKLAIQFFKKSLLVSAVISALGTTALSAQETKT
ncbi:MAG: hypothetical protein ACI9LM_005651, partial [Alteromonadaceae bacterium]